MSPTMTKKDASVIFNAVAIDLYSFSKKTKLKTNKATISQRAE